MISCSSRTFYRVDWVSMPEEFNYPKFSYIDITPSEVAAYREGAKKRMNGRVRGPFVNKSIF